MKILGSGYLACVMIIYMYCEIALTLMSPDLPDDKSTLGQVMDWFPQTTKH